ncbi:hypothetical protein TVAG_324000 [Trichomonas vaginalis G3]|uniref:Bacterial bifunctional deaminase-reductase C-terminal domain-containing protein n=1 Tax=Trichomonas vaginalis (strain ATCC PRA-98 / G3) TaxID=412133 RepID=A2F4A2_TRIV3|nr:cupin domain-containing protein family [Trichomonas vaginalis G3]EAY00281.1 hypothetical protein TVAG_324000 [Trichomonas vaginalis G3]KAI5492717.1 cupin domain-containing protein family [Trichomonas vaginalis G3]|eukprot:XP_001313210.1 hypothetical protein [Trichomonas vaginalis G3]
METGNATASLNDFVWTIALYKADAAICGSNTALEMGYQNPDINSERTDVPEGNFIAKDIKSPFLVVLDSTVKVGWKQGYANKPLSPTANIIEVLSEKASPQYKNYFRRLNISYIIAGKDHVDLVPAVRKLKNVFGIKVLGVLGGATLCWSVVKSGICNELSICLSVVGEEEGKKPRFLRSGDVVEISQNIKH